jgi:very-short-patch-repair endonuclease
MLIQINLTEDTLNKIARLKKRLNIDTRTNSIRSAINIADLIVDAVCNGDSVIIEKNGIQHRLMIPGISQVK